MSSDTTRKTRSDTTFSKLLMVNVWIGGVKYQLISSVAEDGGQRRLGESAKQSDGDDGCQIDKGRGGQGELASARSQRDRECRQPDEGQYPSGGAAAS